MKPPPRVLASVMDGEHVAATVIHDGAEIRIKPEPGYQIVSATMSVVAAKTTPALTAPAKEPPHDPGTSTKQRKRRRPL